MDRVLDRAHRRAVGCGCAPAHQGALGQFVASLELKDPIVRGHHERLDGNGYPDRLAGAAIPLAARIVRVCDAYDAMAHTRQYRVGMGDDRALAILREHAGSQWDPVIVNALIGVVRRTGDGSSALEDVGRLEMFDESSVDGFCGCADALPIGLLADQTALVGERLLASA